MDEADLFCKIFRALSSQNMMSCKFMEVVRINMHGYLCTLKLHVALDKPGDLVQPSPAPPQLNTILYALFCVFSVVLAWLFVVLV